MAVTAKMVKELREMTGAGMMDCKKALVETDGNIEAAVDLFKEKGLAKAAKKAGRVAAMGLVRTAIAADGKSAAIVEVNSETDFVAKNDEFVTFVETLAQMALENDAADMDAFMALPYEDEFVKNIVNKIKEKTALLTKMSDYEKVINMFEGNEDFAALTVNKLDLSTGEIDLQIPVNENLYYKMLSKECGEEILDDYSLMKYVIELVKDKKQYDKIKTALDMVKETGYGIVNPSLADLELSEPEIVTKNGNSSLKLKASAPSLHIMRVDVNAEICPAVGSVEQSGSLVTYMMNEFENNKEELWNKNMFGKPMNELVKDSIDTKLAGLPEEVQIKLRKTLTKIVNERKGGVICILL